jgi:fatty acid desaturase
MTAPASLIYGCEHPRRLRAMTRADLGPEIRGAVRRLQQLDPRRNLRLLQFLLLWGIAGWACIAFDSPIIAAASWVTIAGALVGLSVMMHEGAHHLLCRSRWLSRFIGFLCGLPLLMSVSAYRSLHLRHHAHERSPADPDDIENVPRKGIPLVLVYYVMLIIGTYLYFPHVAIRGFKAARGRTRGLVLLEYAVITAAIVSAWRLAPDAMIQLWLFPMMVAAQITGLRSIAEHGLTTGGSPFTASRSVLTNRLVSFFLCNLNYHLEHHLFPAVPWYNLPQLHGVLMPAYRASGASVYGSYLEFMRDFLRITWSGVIPNVRLLPEHLREDLCA